MARFSHLYLKNWRNFSRVDVDVQRRAFVVGPNAVGKSNLLDVFRFLHDIVAVGGGFQEAVRRRGGVASIRSLAARRDPSVTVKATIEEEKIDRWTYELTFSHDSRRRRPLIRQEVITRADRVILRRPDHQDEADGERLTQTYLEQVHANQAFRAVAEFFDSVRYLHVVPQLIRDPDRSVGRANDPFGGDLLEQIARSPERTRTGRLRRILEVLRVAVPQLAELELYRDERGTPHLRGTYEHWRPQGAWQTEEHFSDGTLRLLGLLWAVMDGSGPLLLEEPELSLHPEVIRYIPQMLARVQRRSKRQVLISTHSRELLSDPGIGLDEVLLLQPSHEGTTIVPAGYLQDIRLLLDGDVPLDEIVTPRTAPASASQVALLGV